jgi:hypothetical protein
VCPRQIATLAREAERSFAAQANQQVSENAIDIVEATLNRRSMQPLKAALLFRFESSLDTVMEDTAIVNQVEEFLKHHTSKGPREKTSQDAVDAVLVTLTFEKNCSAENIAKRVGMGKGAVQNCKKRSIDMILSGHHFLPSEREKRKDSVKEPAEAGK